MAVSAANVRPWKEASALMMTWRAAPDVKCAWRRTSLIAASLASAPLLQKKARVPGTRAASSSASRTDQGLR